MNSPIADPRDVGVPGTKEWEEFRASFSAAYLLVWLTEEAGGALLEYAEDLQLRFMSGWDLQENLEYDAEVPDEERGFPLPPVGGVQAPNWVDGLAWMDDSEAQSIYDQLFPHRDSLDDFRQVTASMAVVALHAAIEVYARACGIYPKGLPRSIEKWLSKRPSGPLDSATMRVFTDLAATRHIVVHNRAIVDENYIRQVSGSDLREGEFRIVKHADLHAFARSTWRVAEAIRDMST